jgi:hypothetical protein
MQVLVVTVIVVVVVVLALELTVQLGEKVKNEAKGADKESAQAEQQRVFRSRTQRLKALSGLPFSSLEMQHDTAPDKNKEKIQKKRESGSVLVKREEGKRRENESCAARREKDDFLDQKAITYRCKAKKRASKNKEMMEMSSKEKTASFTCGAKLPCR